MGAALEPGDRKLLIAAAGLLVAVCAVGALVSPSSSSGLPWPSSYSPSSGGAKAAYDLLAVSGNAVERWSRPPEDLPAPANGAVLVLADPWIPPEPEDAASLRAFLLRGGRVLATGPKGAALLFQKRLMPIDPAAAAWGRFSPEQPAPLVAGAPEIEMKSSSRWPPLVGNQQRYYGDKRGAVVVAYSVGRGEAIWWASSTPLTNYGVTQASNLALFLNSVGSRPVRVLWDEYFHGERRGFFAYAVRTPLLWGLAQLALLVAAALFTYGRRSGPLRPLSTAGSRLSPLEFVETIGGLYERKRAAGGALEIAYERFRSLAARRLGLGPKATAAELYSGARQRLGWTVPGLWETLDRSERGARSGAVPEAQALRLVRELHDYGRRLGFALYQ